MNNRICQIDGLTEHTGDWLAGQKLKELGYDVYESECEENNSPHSARWQDIVNSNAVLMYSFGCATGWDVTNGWHKVPGQKRFKLGIIVAGVLDWTKGQFAGWTPPDCFDRFYCFQPPAAFPTSQPLIGVPWVDIKDARLVSQLGQDRFLNINCDAIFSPTANPIDQHKTVQNHILVLNTIAQLVQKYLPLETI